MINGYNVLHSFFFFWSDEHVLEVIVVMVNSVNTLKTMTCTI